MVLPRGNRRIHVGGRHVSGCLLDLLQRRGYAVSRGTFDMEAIRGLKESLCYVARDIQGDSRVGQTDRLQTSKPCHHAPVMPAHRRALLSL